LFARQVVIATNIAATSVTIDGIKFVVDSGYVKQKQYDARTGMDALVVTTISRSAAEQRAGRAGRTQSGKCYRLYSTRFFNELMEAETKPEIQRTSLANTVLTLKKLGIKNVMAFDFMDPPDAATLVKAMVQLYLLEALSAKGRITKCGETMSAFPLAPSLSRLLVASDSFQCGAEATTVAAMLSVEDVFVRKDARQLAREFNERAEAEALGLPRSRDSAIDATEKFHHRFGDHWAMVKIYDEFSQLRSHARQRWCHEHGLRYRALVNALDVRRQIAELMKAQRLPLLSVYSDRDKRKSACETQLVQAVCESLWYHAARKNSHNQWYIPMMPSMRTLVLQAHPTSVVYGKEGGTDWVVFHDVLTTTRSFMLCVSLVDEAWVKPKLPMLNAIDVDMLCGGTVTQRIKLMSGVLELPTELSKTDEEPPPKPAAYADKPVDQRAAEVAAARERYLKRKRG
jgi:HrpA-like RNA helicase